MSPILFKWIIILKVTVHRRKKNCQEQVNIETRSEINMSFENPWEISKLWTTALSLNEEQQGRKLSSKVQKSSSYSRLLSGSEMRQSCLFFNHLRLAKLQQNAAN